MHCFGLGPTCTLNGSEVPTCVTYSKNDSITSHLLTTMFSNMDDLEIFDQSEGVNPFLLCDGHGSQFKEPLLEHTLESNIIWTCFIGVSYGTSMWQDGDSAEQNGTFKIETKQAHACTVRNKTRASLPATLEKSNIVCIVNIAWQNYFARVDTNKRAIAASRWGPHN
jgi:hypothetical protein